RRVTRRVKLTGDRAMIARMFATTIATLLGIYAFWADVLGAGHFLNPFGILFLFLAGLIWFAWEPIRDGFRSAKNESELPISRLGSTIVKGMLGMGRREHPRRPPTPN